MFQMTNQLSCCLFLYCWILLFVISPGVESLYASYDDYVYDTPIEQNFDDDCQIAAARVINGEQLRDIDRFPYIVAIQIWEEDLGIYAHYCGGVLISSNMVVTAAHCIYLKSLNAGGTSDFRTNSFNEGPFKYKDVVVAIQPACRHQSGLGRIGIERYYIPREYNGRPTNPNGFDIAVLVLEQEVPIPGPFANFEAASELNLQEVPLFILLGYGGISAGERGNRFLYASRVTPLRVGPLSYLEPQVCQEIVSTEDPEYSINKDRVLCAFNENVDACFGDSGGPLIYADGANQLDIQKGEPSKDVFVGLVSWGPDWACTSITGFPGVYTKISSYVGWIQSVMAREQSPEFLEINEIQQNQSTVDIAAAKSANFVQP
eukprot:TRINITY_DN8737_c0_g1_i1.p1 TRINITY_DN8737_c0_g1~~TRINITY_DN8737_c0_g1_i1.p1  ORF type:complete len:375 (-),score=27.75 TRINITY_DN8737_c0_g1_i1:339-1463(-)